MSRTNCEHCNALVTPGASFCLACFIPFDDEPARPAEAPAAVPVGAPVPAAVGAPAAPANDFFAPAAPPQFQHHPGQDVDWRATAPVAALLTPTERPPKSVVPKVVAGVVALLVVVGVVFGAKAVFGRPSEKQEMATAFREARPPDLFPAFPSMGSLLGDTGSNEPEAPGAAQAFVQMLDPKIQEANAALLGMQDTMDRWADGKLSDDALRSEIGEFNKVLDAATGFDATIGAPASLQRGIGKLTESAVEYRMALGALLDWLDSQTNGARLTYRLTIGDANLHWDEGLINLYRAADLETPPLPHPQPKKK
ncbi:MAG TPA: hypothetical protein VNA20_09680 [Frankiaceae bacterium]|nr:hypothetical protein [Frankiaceae bacterium]